MDAAVGATGGHLIPPDTTSAALREAILQTLAYVDVFDYPLTLVELQRYLIGLPATLNEVEAALRWMQPAGLVSGARGFFALAGRDQLVDRRLGRRATARLFWQQARSYGRLLAALPFVRLVAVTGSLASDNVDPQADIDYFVVTAPDRLWLCRAMIVGIVRLAALRGVTLCPNFFVSSRALALPTRNLYTARELAQMVPLSGLAAYRALRAANPWTAAYLPNAAGPPRLFPGSSEAGRPRLEALLPARPAARLERWERRRKLARFAAQAAGAPPGETHFSADICQGHFDGHGARTLRAFNAHPGQGPEKKP